MEFHTIKKVKTLKDMIIQVTFKNGIRKEYDIKQLIEKFGAFEELQNEDLFNKAKVDIGGYGIIWNENIDLSCEEIWKNGY